MGAMRLPGGVVAVGDGGSAPITPGPAETRRNIWYVDGSLTSASDAAGYGKNKNRPFQRIAYAHDTAASAGDVIVVLATHRSPDVSVTDTEDERMTLTCNKAHVSFYGAGAGDGRVILRGVGAATSGVIFDIIVDGVEVDGFILTDYLDDLMLDTRGWPVNVATGVGTRIGACEFRQLSSSRMLMLTSGLHTLVEDTTFKNVRTSFSATGSTYGIYMSSGVNGLTLQGCSFDGGTYGIGTGAVYQPAGATNTGFLALSCTLANDADMVFVGSSFKGAFIDTEASAACRIEAPNLRSYDYGVVLLGGGDSALSGGVSCTGNVYWLDNSSATASDANSGTDPYYPLSTIAQAFSAMTAANGDLIIVGAGHRENLTGSLGGNINAVSKADTQVWGLGTGSARAQFTVIGTPVGTGNTVAFNCTGAGFRMDNVRFASSTYAPTVSGLVTMIQFGALNHVVRNCTFAPNVNYDGASIVIGSAAPYRIDGCTFTLAATAGTTGSTIQTTYAIYCATAAGNPYSRIGNCIFSAGSLRQWARGITINGSTHGPQMLTNTLIKSWIVLSSNTTLAYVAGTIPDEESAVVFS